MSALPAAEQFVFHRPAPVKVRSLPQIRPVFQRNAVALQLFPLIRTFQQQTARVSLRKILFPAPDPDQNRGEHDAVASAHEQLAVVRQNQMFVKQFQVRFIYILFRFRDRLVVFPVIFVILFIVLFVFVRVALPRKIRDSPAGSAGTSSSAARRIPPDAAAGSAVTRLLVPV